MTVIFCSFREILDSLSGAFVITKERGYSTELYSREAILNQKMKTIHDDKVNMANDFKNVKIDFNKSFNAFKAENAI